MNVIALREMEAELRKLIETLRILYQNSLSLSLRNDRIDTKNISPFSFFRAI